MKKRWRKRECYKKCWVTSSKRKKKYNLKKRRERIGHDWTQKERKMRCDLEDSKEGIEIGKIYGI